MKHQAVNPYLPLGAYIPDGEPHLFDGRVYVFGSHDEEGGEAFCLLDYEVWSCPEDDLGNWTCDGTIYAPQDDPDYSETYYAMYAPDVVKGNDGRYYLYYAMSGRTFTGPLHVAVCDEPAGRYHYYGCVQNPDGTPYTRKITFDPGLMNDDGTIRLYYGWSLDHSPGAATPEEAKAMEESEEFREKLHYAESMLFSKPMEEVLSEEAPGVMGAFVVTLEDDMLTVKDGPKWIAPGHFDANGTSFEGHAFFEASSMRKIGDTYYFIYSSEHQHELCYATSPYPDRDFTFGGVLISNGDIGMDGRDRSHPAAMTGNNHGSLVCVKGQWYLFYHRQTHKTTYSRQGCAEKITILPDGSILQVRMTSCGLNDGPLAGSGTYPAPICCVLEKGSMPHADRDVHKDDDIPCVTHEGEERFVGGISDQTAIGYRYFDFTQTKELSLFVRGDQTGAYVIFPDSPTEVRLAVSPSEQWEKFTVPLSGSPENGELTLRYEGEGHGDLLKLELS